MTNIHKIKRFFLISVVLAILTLMPAVLPATTNLWNRGYNSDFVISNLDNLHNTSEIYPVLFRNARQTTRNCGSLRWKCKDGSCIKLENLCDGKPNCQDKSDEIFSSCHNMRCQSYLFQCSYGACVDGDVKCNGVNDCADESDELHKDCMKPTVNSCSNNQFQCSDRECIDNDLVCDGRGDCADNSDESLQQCSHNTCQSYLFRCAYGACVDGDSLCNRVIDCIDGSDEVLDVCIGINPLYKPVTTPNIITTTTTTTEAPGVSSCILPNYPEKGLYLVNGKAPFPGTRVDEFTLLFYECDKNYSPTPNKSAFCLNGNWNIEVQCIRECKSLVSSTVDFECSYQGNTIPCNGQMLSGTVVKSACKTRHIETASNLRLLKCINGDWDYPTPKCVAECGLEKSKGTGLSINSIAEIKGGSPWQVAIYRKTGEIYGHICGGTIITNILVISAAHCFHDDAAGTIMNETLINYAVAAGKYFRSWDSPLDKTAQKSELSNIFKPESYGGHDQNLQQDIVVLVLKTQLKFTDSVHPVCLDLISSSFQKLQVSPGNLGKAVGWGLTIEGDVNSASESLMAVNIPVVDYATCKAKVPSTFVRYLTVDKFCAGWLNGTALCSGDSGGGLVFSADERGTTRWYLRGIVSVSDLDDTRTTCRKDMYTAFTNVFRHKDFISDLMESYV
ncbi:modular serine protease-like [Arctopsyche grandis]|uniref:modular serine protease-like n=1 Tax=Arctopsyche grandis TaxID=121162 RepID=UPI00406D72BF